MAQVTRATIAVTDVGTQDVGEDYIAFERTKPYLPATSLNRFGVRNAALQATPASGVSLQVRAFIDYGLRTRTKTVQLTPQADEADAAQVIRAIDDFSFAEVTAVQLEIRDQATPTGRWEADALVLVTRPEQTS